MKNHKFPPVVLVAFAIFAALIGQSLRESYLDYKIQKAIKSYTVAGKAYRSAGYFEGLNDGLKAAGSSSCDCGCSSRTINPADTSTEDPTPTTTTYVSKTKTVKKKHLPILMNYVGTWLDQDGQPMDYADSETFFKQNREYAKVAVAINSLCKELQSDFYQECLDDVSEWANRAPHDCEEYLTYDWVLAEMTADYDNYLNDLLALIGDQIDYDSSSAANTATRIILGKMLEFRADGTYDAAINPHRKHDCEAEGCRTTTTPPASQSILDALPIVGDLAQLSDAEIVAYLDANVTAPTEFDRQHPSLYFDRLGRVHGCKDPSEELYYATSNGRVYLLNHSTDLDRIGESPLSDKGPIGMYVGRTNRILK